MNNNDDDFNIDETTYEDDGVELDEDYSFEDDEYTEEGEEETGEYQTDSPFTPENIKKWAIILTVSFVTFITVYFITDALINGGNKAKEVPLKDTPMTLNDEMVTYLYGNVSFGIRGMRNPIFFKNEKVTIDNFSNNDKFFFVARYLTSSDFTAIYEEVDVTGGTTTTTTETTTKTDENGNTTTETDVDVTTDENTDTVMKIKEFSIANETIKAAMEDFFGDGVTYNYEGEIPFAANFTVDGNNAGLLRYDSTSDSFLINFDRKSDLTAETVPIKPVYGELVSAIRMAKTSNIILKEHVIFTQYVEHPGEPVAEGEEENDPTYDYKVCADYECTNVLEEKKGVTKAEYYNNPIELADYKDHATTITYTFFKDSNNEFHFLSSERN